jgi:hypothetical protein
MKIFEVLLWFIKMDSFKLDGAKIVKEMDTELQIIANTKL